MALDAFDDPKVAAVAPLVLRWPGAIEGRAIIDSAGDAYFTSGVATKRGNGQTIEEKWMIPGPVFGASGSSAFIGVKFFLRLAPILNLLVPTLKMSIFPSDCIGLGMMSFFNPVPRSFIVFLLPTANPA